MVSLIITQIQLEMIRIQYQKRDFFDNNAEKDARTKSNHGQDFRNIRCTMEN